LPEFNASSRVSRLLSLLFGDESMAKIADHPRPCMPPPPDAVAVTVDLAAFGMPGRSERLVAVPAVDGHYVVACLPFFTYGIQFGDLVQVREPGRAFERVLRPSGLRTFRVAFADRAAAGECHVDLHTRIARAGLPCEWHGAGYAAVLIRDVGDQERALSCIAAAVQDGRVQWEVDPQPFAADAAERGAAPDRPRD
jgi:hypothetical protein